MPSSDTTKARKILKDQKKKDDKFQLATSYRKPSDRAIGRVTNLSTGKRGEMISPKDAKLDLAATKGEYKNSVIGPLNRLRDKIPGATNSIRDNQKGAATNLTRSGRISVMQKENIKNSKGTKYEGMYSDGRARPLAGQAKRAADAQKPKPKPSSQPAARSSSNLLGRNGSGGKGQEVVGADDRPAIAVRRQHSIGPRQNV